MLKTWLEESVVSRDTFYNFDFDKLDKDIKTLKNLDG